MKKVEPSLLNILIYLSKHPEGAKNSELIVYFRNVDILYDLVNLHDNRILKTPDNRYLITLIGRDYLNDALAKAEERKREKYCSYLAIIISILALLISLANLYHQINYGN